MHGAIILISVTHSTHFDLTRIAIWAMWQGSFCSHEWILAVIGRLVVATSINVSLVS
jgi:hypothetical protein